MAEGCTTLAEQADESTIAELADIACAVLVLEQRQRLALTWDRILGGTPT